MKALLNLISSLRSRSAFVAVLLTFTALFSAHAQSPVKGKVVDEDGRPVAGVTVMVKGTMQEKSLKTSLSIEARYIA